MSGAGATASDAGRRELIDSAIIHTASPFHWNVEKPDDFIKPAVAGTVSMLRAAASEPKVQRLVITSSYAS